MTRLMKELLLACTMVLAVGATANAKNTKKTKTEKLFTPGTTLVYQVESGANRYDFIARLTSYSPKAGYSFHWLVTGNRMQGNVTVAAGAADSAMKLYNFFKEGDETLTDQTSVLVSRKAAVAFKARQPVTLDGGKGPVTFHSTDEGGNMPVLVDIKYGDIGALPVFTYEDPAQAQSIDLLDWKDFPLILRMDMGFKIRLIAIL